MQYGQVSPQIARTVWANDEEAWLFSWDDGIPGEDCLRVNVWTPGIQNSGDNKKRPVMVWLHGGGFQAGSGQELPSYVGENLARRGDIVVVSLNHRLGVLGCLNLAEIGGAKYASAANVGNLDLVAALEWVRDNIANFGGDASPRLWNKHFPPTCVLNLRLMLSQESTFRDLEAGCCVHRTAVPPYAFMRS